MYEWNSRKFYHELIYTLQNSAPEKLLINIVNTYMVSILKFGGLFKTMVPPNPISLSSV